MPTVTETVNADPPMADVPATPRPDARPYSPGLEGVIAGETAIALVDGAAGRLLYRGYAIGDVVEHGTYAQVAELLWTGTWPAHAHLPCAHLPSDVLAVLLLLPPSTHPMDALRTGLSAWGAGRGMNWPPTLEQARAVTAVAPSILAAFARIRQGLEPVEADPKLDLAAGFLYQLRGEAPDPAAARALDAYFVVGAEHGFNASTFTALVITSTKSDLVSGIVGAIGALKGPLHGGAPSEVVDQLSQIGTPEHAEAWLRDAIARGERLMGFGHRVYKAYDPRAAALAQGGRGPERHGRLAGPRGRGRGCRAARPGRAEARSHPEDERRVLRGGGPPGRGPAAGPLPGHLRAGASRRLDGALHRVRGDQPAHPAGRHLHRARGAAAARGLARPRYRRHRRATRPCR